MLIAAIPIATKYVTKMSIVTVQIAISLCTILYFALRWCKILCITIDFNVKKVKLKSLLCFGSS